MSEIQKLLESAGKRLGRTPEQMAPFVKILVEDNWLSTVADLKSLDSDFWEKNKFPIKLVQEIQADL